MKSYYNYLKLSTLVIVLLLSLLIINISSSKTEALSGNDFNPGKIIDDAVFYNSSSMSVPEIQQFLNSKVPVCDTNGVQPYAGTTRAAYGASRGYPAPYTCLKDYSQSVPSVTNSGSDLCKGSITGGTKSAAGILYDVSQSCRINPQVLIVMLQKETSLVTDDWPWTSQYDKAMGYACPDSGPNNSANCDSAYFGFFNQVYNAAQAYRRYGANPNGYNYKAQRNNYILYNPNTACGGTSVFIENQATANLYIYTPYQPNAAALANLYGIGDGCSAYGNRNFWRMFNDWFGSTISTIHNGIDYSPVFDAEYYLGRYPDLTRAFGSNKTAAFNHFISQGMSEGRQAKQNFNVISYKNRYPDLRRTLGNNLNAYYMHYVLYGNAENRVATGDVFVGTTIYNGKNFGSVYSFDYYMSNNSDLRVAFGTDDLRAISHFINYGINEGRQGIGSFNVIQYKIKYPDLRAALGDDYARYFWHYIYHGIAEGRTSIL